MPAAAARARSRRVPAQRGVQLVRSREEAETAAANILGHTLVTIQTGPEGKTVHRVLVEEGCSIARELYLAAVIDRSRGGPVLIASTEGGMDIEHVAATTPERILTEPFDVDTGVQPYQVRKLAARAQAAAGGGAERRAVRAGLQPAVPRPRLQPAGDQPAGADGRQPPAGPGRQDDL